MKVIIAGSRTFKDWNLLCAKMAIFNMHLKIQEVVSGTAKGADTLGERWATERDLHITRFPADWDKYGKSAGYKRNEQMAEYADALVAFWDGESRGTMHMIDIMKKHNKPFRTVVYS